MCILLIFLCNNASNIFAFYYYHSIEGTNSNKWTAGFIDHLSWPSKVRCQPRYFSPSSSAPQLLDINGLCYGVFLRSDIIKWSVLVFLAGCTRFNQDSDKCVRRLHISTAACSVCLLLTFSNALHRLARFDTLTFIQLASKFHRSTRSLCDEWFSYFYGFVYFYF